LLVRYLAILVTLACASGCVTVGYEGALGYRSRNAAEQQDAQAFVELMEEASEAEPKSRLDNPKKTVLTHFLDLAKDPAYLQTIDAWNAKGWIDEDMICPVYRAHFGAHAQSSPKQAQASAQLCLQRARAASLAKDRAWEVDLCLMGAPFFTKTSTPTLQPYLQMATSPDEPEPFRRAMLKGLTFREDFSPRERWGVTSTLTPDAQKLFTHRQARQWQRRLTWLLDTLQDKVPATELAIASARGVMEVEQVMNSRGQSFVARYAASEDPVRRQWAWAWVRALKHAEPVDHLGGLGIWDRGREPSGDAYWYICHGPAVLNEGGVLGPRYVAEARSLQSQVRLAGGPDAPAMACAAPEQQIGPFPLEQIARAVAVQQLKASLPTGARVIVRITTRKKTKNP